MALLILALHDRQYFEELNHSKGFPKICLLYSEFLGLKFLLFTKCHEALPFSALLLNESVP
jgi:hypothetical protein